MQTVVGVVEDFKAFGPKEGKFGAYYNHSYTIQGKKFTKNSNSAEPLVTIGKTALIAYVPNITEKGTFNNASTVTLVDSSDSEVKESKTSSPFKSESTTTTSTKTSPTVVKSTTTSKDISMEVSGLLQALVSTGAYNTGNGLSQTLELDIRTLLALKRRVASELEGEQNGLDRPVQSQE
jgi:hypothetical protein